MIDYSKSKIYIIRSGNAYYIGGTTNTLSRCKAGLKVKSNKNDCSKLSQILNSRFCSVCLLEFFPCDTKNQLNKRVRQCRKDYKKKRQSEVYDKSIFNLCLLD